MTDDLTLRRDRYQGQLWDPGRAVPQFVNQRGLGRNFARGLVPRERGARDSPDNIGVARRLASDQHAATMARRQPGRNRISGAPNRCGRFRGNAGLMLAWSAGLM
jgi:hypothetical protein